MAKSKSYTPNCKYETATKSFFGLPENIKEGDAINVDYGTLVAFADWVAARYPPSSIPDVFSFDEIQSWAKENTPAPHWAFEFAGFQFSHEDDNCYIVNGSAFRRGQQISLKETATII